MLDKTNYDHSSDASDYDISRGGYSSKLAQDNDQGNVFAKEKNYSSAIGRYNEALQYSEESTISCSYISYNKGNACSEIGDYSEAFKCFMKIAESEDALRYASPFSYIAYKICNLGLSERKQEDMFKLCADLFKCTRNIREELLYTHHDSEKVTHYTGHDALKYLISGEPFKLYNTGYMNDPNEGNKLFVILSERLPGIVEEINNDVELSGALEKLSKASKGSKGKGSKGKGMGLKEVFYKPSFGTAQLLPAYVGSFVEIDPKYEDDSLLLWRTYGKHNGEEATGACLVYDTDQFADTFTQDYTQNMIDRPTLFRFAPNNEVLSGKLILKVGRSPLISRHDNQVELYKVVYEVEAYKDKHGNNKLQELLDELIEFLAKIHVEVKKIKKKSIQNSLLLLASEVLDTIRFLFKAHYFKEENEVRAIIILYVDKNKLEEQEVLHDSKSTPPRYYIELPGIKCSKVILGPKVSDSEHSGWDHWVQIQGSSIKIEKSEIPFI